jgi:hypothetical protein
MQKGKAGGVVPGKPIPVSEHPHPPTVENLRLILLRSIEHGVIIPSDHFNSRCTERGFCWLDAEVLVEEGTIVSGPDYDPQFHSFQCEIEGRIDGKSWRLVTALDCNSDYLKSPRVILVTVHRSRPRRVQRK